jgi:membrane protein
MPAIKGILVLLRDTVAAFLQDRATIYAAGLAYYTVFSLAPLLVFVVTVAGLFIGRSAASEQIVFQLQMIVGEELGGFLEELLSAINGPSSAGTITAVSLVGLLFGATGIFNQIKNSVNILWGLVPRRPRGARDYLQVARSRAIPFLMVFLFGLLLSAVVLIDTVLGLVQSRVSVFFPELGAALPSLSRIVVPALTFVTFALIYKLLPDARVRWRDIWPGALLAALLFLVGRSLLELFLDFSDTGSAFGAAGSLVVLLVWVFFSANMLLLGAEFVKLYATRFGHPIRPGPTARFEGDPIVEEGALGPSGLSLDERVL